MLMWLKPAAARRGLWENEDEERRMRQMAVGRLVRLKSELRPRNTGVIIVNHRESW